MPFPTHRLKGMIRRYLNLFLPLNHPLIKDDVSRYQINIATASGTLFFLIFATYAGWFFFYDNNINDAVALFFTACFISFSIFTAALFKGRALLVLTLFTVIISSAILYFFNIKSLMFPPFTVYFIPAVTLFLHLAFGRWVSLIVFLALIASVEIYVRYGVLDSITIDIWNSSHLNTLTFLNSLVVWLIAEFYVRLKNRTTAYLKHIRREMEHDMDVAFSIQMDLLPKDAAVGSYEFSGLMKSAIRVGGDYYDHLYDDPYHWFAMGDATGHGLKAGMFAMQVRIILHHLIRHHPKTEPEDILRELNNSFYENLATLQIRNFISFVLLRLSDDGGCIAIGSHLQIFCYRAKSRTIDVYEPRGSWIGISHYSKDEQIAKPIHFHLDKGDTLLLYTDGFTDAVGSSNQLFGDEGLKSYFYKHINAEPDAPLNQIHQAVYQDFMDFMERTTFDDDLTLLSIRKL